MSLTWRWGSLAAIAGGVALWMCLSPVTSGQSPAEEELWRHRNLGKALFENPATVAEAPAELKKALDLAPNSFRDRLNYGIALLRAGDTEAAITELEAAQKLDPSLPNTWFNLGIAYKRQERNEDAIRQLQRMTQLVPDEPVSHYNLGVLYNLENRGAEALEQFQTAARLDPNFVAPRFQLYNHYRLNGDEAAARQALADFQAVKARQQGAGETEDVEWNYYSELYDPLTARPAGKEETPATQVRFEDRKMGGTLDASSAGILVFDPNGGGTPAALAWGRGGVRLYLRGKDITAQSGLGGLRGVVSVAAGDYDNDGLEDLCVLTEQGALLMHNNRGRFADAHVQLAAGHFEKAIWLDFDHDYDLDLLLLGDKSALMRNQGDGFQDYTSHFPFATGRAIDAAALRVIPDSKSIDLAVAYADGKGVLYRDMLHGEFRAEDLASVPAGSKGLQAIDIDNDGWMDLTYSQAGEVWVARNSGGKFTAQATGAKGTYALADLENRGFADLIASNGVFRNLGLAQFAAATRPAGWMASNALAAADFEDDGKTGLAAVAADGSVHQLINRTATKNSWLRVGLTGVKNLKSAAGSEIEIRAGGHYQKAAYEGLPVDFGLGAYTRADSVRITWPNGLIQNQTNEAANRTVVIKEAPRLSGSCPMIFTWNGRGFQFITDVLGVAPLGASSGDGDYFPVDHHEYVAIPAEALAANHGRYDIRVTEELHEVTYLDQAQLIAVDHPAGVEIYTNDKFKSPPFPDFRLFGVSRRIHAVAAHDDAGHDVLAGVLKQDGTYATGFSHDSGGIAEMHGLTLDFGADAARDNKAALYLHGWVDWADGSEFLNASQRRAGGLVFPYLQVKDESGQWRTVIEDMGIPSGKPKTIAVDLTGKFLSRSREVRIVTNLCVFWDEIFLGESAGAPQARLTPIDAESANLRLRGFSNTVIDPRREQPEDFEYSKWTPEAAWNQVPGLYTRYGDVRELAVAADDRLVLMGSGDELQLSFSAAGLPALPAGWRRDFLLLIDGWAKDSDANTAFSQSVEPLPFHAMSRYPYPAPEKFPDDAGHRSYRAQYNTRPAVQFVAPMVMERITGGAR